MTTDKTTSGILTWERTDPGNVNGQYAFDARHPDDDNPSHWYQCLLREETIDLPKAERRFYSTWLETDTDLDETLGENLTLEEAMQRAEQHAAARKQTNDSGHSTRTRNGRVRDQGGRPWNS